METEIQRIHDAVKLLGDTALDLATALSSLGNGALEPTIAGTGTALVATFRRPGDPKPPPEDELPAPQRVNLYSVAHKALKTGFVVEVYGLLKEMGTRHLRDRKGNKLLFLTLTWPETAGERPKYCEDCEVVVPWEVSTDTAALAVGAEVLVTGRMSLDGEAVLRMWADKIVVERPAPEKVEPAKSYNTGRVLSAARAKARVKAAARATSAGYDYEHWCSRVLVVRNKLGGGQQGLAAVLGVTISAVKGWEAGVSFARPDTRNRIESVSRHLFNMSHLRWKQPA